VSDEARKRLADLGFDDCLLEVLHDGRAVLILKTANDLLLLLRWAAEGRQIQWHKQSGTKS
jgi:hypothetical protein